MDLCTPPEPGGEIFGLLEELQKSQYVVNHFLIMG